MKSTLIAIVAALPLIASSAFAAPPETMSNPQSGSMQHQDSMQQKGSVTDQRSMEQEGNMQSGAHSQDDMHHKSMKSELPGFNDLDTNQTGCLSKKEAGAPKAPGLVTDWSKADKNKDGKLSRSEYMIWRSGQKNMNHPSDTMKRSPKTTGQPPKTMEHPTKTMEHSSDAMGHSSSGDNKSNPPETN